MRRFFSTKFIVCLYLLCSSSNFLTVPIEADSKTAAYYYYFNSKANTGYEGTQYGSVESSGTFSSYNNTYVGSSMPEGGTTGYGVDMMKMIAQADPTTSSARMYKELLELYVKASEGALCTATHTLEPTVYAAMHKNETSSSTFLDTQYEYNSNHTLSLFGSASKVSTLAYASSGSSVMKDANGDGVPDGPFQIENGSNVPSSSKSTMNPAGANLSRGFDMWFFPDCLSWVNHDFSSTAKSFNLDTDTDGRLLAMYASAKHNRGSFYKQAWGVPYTASSSMPSVSLSSKVTAGTYSADTIAQIDASMNSLLDTFDKLNPTITSTDNTAMRSLAIYLALCDGWYFSSTIDTTSLITKLPNLFSQLVPSSWSGTTVEYIEATYVKNPWDVIGITSEQYNLIYGTTNYRNHYNWLTLFKVEDYTSDCYINKMPDGSDPYVVHAWDNIVLGHMVGSSVMGDYIFLELLIKAGFPAEYEGVVTDASNPSTMYNKFLSNNADTYLPISMIDSGGDFAELVSLLDIRTSAERLLSLSSVYEQLGTKYFLGGGGYEIKNSNYAYHENWSGMNGTGTSYLLDNFYYTKDGTGYNSTTLDSELSLYGKRMFDCSTLALCGPSLGRTGSLGMYYQNNSAGIAAAGKNGGKDDYYTLNGVTYNTGWDVVQSNYYTLSEYQSKGSTLVEGGLQPGDIMVRDGHTLTVLCIASKDVTIPKDIARSGSDVQITAGSLVVLEAWNTGEYNRVRNKGWTDPNKFIVLRPKFF